MYRKLKIILPEIGAFLLFVISLIVFTGCSSPSSESSVLKDTLEVHFIDVGQGDSILIEVNGEDMLIDAGENDKGDEVVDYLKSENVTELDYIIGTHPHSDHIGGMDTVLTAIPAEQVILPANKYKTKTYQDVLNELDENNTKEIEAKAGDSYSLGSASFTILAPCSVKYSDLNDYSVCIRLTYGDSTFLFTGDAEALSEKEMLNSGEELSADVLKLGHHGSSYSSCEDFLAAVNPEYGVISVGTDNKYGHPDSETLQAMLEHSISLYRTDKQGTIIFTSDGKDISVNTQPYKLTENDLMNK